MFWTYARQILEYVRERVRAIIVSIARDNFNFGTIRAKILANESLGQLTGGATSRQHAMGPPCARPAAM